MHTKKLVCILGDIHADMRSLNAFIDLRIRIKRIFRQIAEECSRSGDDFEALILQCGDFGYFWPSLDNMGVIRNEVDFLTAPTNKFVGFHKVQGRPYATGPKGWIAVSC